MINWYLSLKSLHILAAVLFLGNLVVTGWWKTMADRTRDAKVIAFAQRQVTLTDYVFTGGGVGLLLATGIGNAVLHDMDYLSIPWMAWGLWLFTAAGVIWVTVLIPVQLKQARMARAFADGGPIPEPYWRLGRLWAVFGTIATILPLSVIFFMVFKPT